MRNFSDTIARTRRTARLALGAAALTIAATAPARADVIDLRTEVAAARVYPVGASVSRLAAFSADVGRHELVAADLPLRIDPSTLRVRLLAGEAASLLGIRYRRPQAQPPSADDPAREALEAEIRDVEWRQRAAIDAAEAAEAERAYLEAFRSATADGGEDQGGGDLLDRLDAWPAAWTRISNAHAQAQAAVREAQREAEELDRRLEDLRDQLADLAPETPRGALIATIRADEAISDGVLEVSYLTNDAGWRPLYDLRLTGAATPGAPSNLALVRRAAVSQRSGEDWEGVELTLSTARPSDRMVVLDPPETEARFAAPRAEYAAAPLAALSGQSASDQAYAEQSDDRRRRLLERGLTAVTSAPSAPAQAVAAFEGAQVSFTAPDRVDLSGDGETAQIFLLEAAEEVTLEARTTPSLDATAYLYAVYQNAQTPILPGQASIFRDDVFVGRTALEPAAPGEQTALPLGPLNDIKVTHRLRERRQGEEGVFVAENRRRARFEITVANLGDAPMPMVVYDSAVFTEDDDIEIELQSTPRPTERDVAQRRGTVAWRFELAPGQTREIAFGYDITWPEGQEIQLIGGGPRPF